jgi:predicted RNase H-like HicB family nuclease
VSEFQLKAAGAAMFASPRPVLPLADTANGADGISDVNCPALPGCWSQGETEEEAMQNIRDAIEDYLAAVKESVRRSDVREVEVSL